MAKTVKKFAFSSVTTELEIAGRMYRVDCNSDRTLAAMNQFADGCIELSKQSGKIGEDETRDRSIPLMEKMLDTVLGGGACDDIFAVRGRNFDDMYELSMYVCQCVSEARSTHSADRINSMQNRAQRRSANQKHSSHKNRQQKAVRQTPSFSDLSQPEKERILAFARDAIARGDITLGNEYGN